jgi:hypothetical protein
MNFNKYKNFILNSCNSLILPKFFDVVVVIFYM